MQCNEFTVYVGPIEDAPAVGWQKRQDLPDGQVVLVNVSSNQDPNLPLAPERDWLLYVGSADKFPAGMHRGDEKALAASLTGHFAAAWVSKTAAECTLVSDRFASHPLYHCNHGKGLLFGSHLKSLLTYIPQPEINPQAIYHYCYFHMIPSPMTLYQGIFRLAPSQCLSRRADGTITTDIYWLPNFSEASDTGTQLEERLRETLADSVKRHGSDACGSFLSGGLDSSTVTGLMCEHTSNRDAFSIGFPVAAYNELKYARCAVNHFGAKGHEYIMSPEDVLEALPVIAAGMEQPFGNSSALPTYFCAKFAKEKGVHRLLAGDGGDELFAGNARYAKQHLFQHYAELPAGLRAISDPLLTANLWSRIPGAAKVSSYVKQACVPLPDRLQSYNFLHRLDPSGIFRPEFLDSVSTDQPLAELRQEYARPREASALNRMLYMDWKYTLADNDIVKVSSMCRLAGVDVRYPMLDDAVVDLSCRVPSNLKLTPKHLRHFYKQAFSGFLPHEIINKPKHGFGLPFGIWLKEAPALQAQAMGSLENLRQLDVFNPAFISQAMQLNRQSHAAYWGELVWVLMMLGLWLEQHQPLASAPPGGSTVAVHSA